MVFIASHKMSIEHTNGYTKNTADYLKDLFSIVMGNNNSVDTTKNRDSNEQQDYQKIDGEKNKETDAVQSETQQELSILSQKTQQETKNIGTLQQRVPNKEPYNKPGYFLQLPAMKDHCNSVEQRYGLPTGLLQQVMKMESAGTLWKNNAIIGSSAGAQGLFQFMPATAKETAQALSKEFSTQVDIQDIYQSPYRSALASGLYLKKHLGQTTNTMQSIGITLAAYNRGMGNMKRIFGNSNAFDPRKPEDLAKLPKETQKYVINGLKGIGIDIVSS